MLGTVRIDGAPRPFLSWQNAKCECVLMLACGQSQTPQPSPPCPRVQQAARPDRHHRVGQIVPHRHLPEYHDFTDALFSHRLSAQSYSHASIAADKAVPIARCSIYKDRVDRPQASSPLPLPSTPSLSRHGRTQQHRRRAKQTRRVHRIAESLQWLSLCPTISPLCCGHAAR